MLRPAFFSHTRTFLWFSVSIAGLSVRTDHLGVTSIVRALSIQGCRDFCLPNRCCSKAINLRALVCQTLEPCGAHALRRARRQPDSLRFEIERSFKQAARVIGTYHHRSWMQDMDRLARYGGDQDLRERSVTYRRHVWRKLEAYPVFLFMGVVTQGLMQYLAACHTDEIWRSFGSWLRTVRRGVAPSEFVVREALRQTLGEFLLKGHGGDTLAEFIVQNQRRDRASSWPIVV